MLWTKRCDNAEGQVTGNAPDKFLLLYQLGFFLFETVGMLIPSFAITVVPCILIVFFVMMVTFDSVYEKSGESFLLTVFTQGGGVFTVLHIAAAMFVGAAYKIYKAVKESYVIPNFTEQQICDARELYHLVGVTLIFMLGSYVVFAVLPLIITSIISYVRKKRTA